MGTHPIFESDFDCLTGFISFQIENGRPVEFVEYSIGNDGR